jgi:membrane protein implicated in regulation of membrane protease activity
VENFGTVNMLLSLVATMFGLLVLVLGWMGSKVYDRLGEMAASMHNIESDLHGKIGALDRRVTRVEARVEISNGGHLL